MNVCNKQRKGKKLHVRTSISSTKLEEVKDSHKVCWSSVFCGMVLRICENWQACNVWFSKLWFIIRSQTSRSPFTFDDWSVSSFFFFCILLRLFELDPRLQGNTWSSSKHRVLFVYIMSNIEVTLIRSHPLNTSTHIMQEKRVNIEHVISPGPTLCTTDQSSRSREFCQVV